MEDLDCNEVKRKWQSYVDGECTSDERQQIQEHIASCSFCKQLDTANGKKKKFQAIRLRLGRWHDRLFDIFSFFIYFLIASIFSGIFTVIYFGFGGEDAKEMKAPQIIRTATQMTMPNVYLHSGGVNTGFYFTMDINFGIYKRIGKEEKAIGKLDGKMFFNNLSVHRDWTNGQYDVKLHFLHPYFVANAQESEQTFYKEDFDEVWDTLDILPEGTVSELAITFDDLYEIDDVYRILEDYDLEIVWYAIDTGTEKDGDRHGSPYLNAAGEIWGFHERSVFDFARGGGSIQINGDGEKRAQFFKTGLKYLADHEKLTRKYLRFLDKEYSIHDRYRFVEENGVKTYGVVVTGPTKELLAMQNNDAILYASLGEVEFWNWYSRSSSGTIYN